MKRKNRILLFSLFIICVTMFSFNKSEKEESLKEPNSNGLPAYPYVEPD